MLGSDLCISKNKVIHMKNLTGRSFDSVTVHLINALCGEGLFSCFIRDIKHQRRLSMWDVEIHVFSNSHRRKDS